MITIGNDQLMTFAQAACLVPSRTGRAVHVSTIHRWAASGAGGVRLESVRFGGTRMTSLEAMQRFLDQLNQTTGLPSAPHATVYGRHTLAARPASDRFPPK